MNIKKYIKMLYTKNGYYISIFILIFKFIKILNNFFEFSFSNEINNDIDKNKDIDTTVVNLNENKELNKYSNVSNISYSIRFLLYIWIGVKIYFNDVNNIDVQSISNIILVIELIDKILVDIIDNSIEEDLKKEEEEEKK